jgi:ABC-type transport system involved in Fe-S cluster assembly fused permease/ATPase subunit
MINADTFLPFSLSLSLFPALSVSTHPLPYLCCLRPAFDHLLNLSLAWHTKKKTGEVLRILDRGSSLNNLFQLILFNILPIFFDVGAALFIFFFRFGPLLAVSIFVVYVPFAPFLTFHVRSAADRSSYHRFVV